MAREMLDRSSQTNEEQLVLDILNPDKIGHALSELSKQRDVITNLGPTLWYSCSTVAALIQEITVVYPMLTPPTLTSPASGRVCNALALLQSVAQHPETRKSFMHSQIALFFIPFLKAPVTSKPFEYLRITTLGVLGAFVKDDDAEVINFLVGTEIVPLCLKIMDESNDLSKTVATFIIQKVLAVDVGLKFMTASDSRIVTVVGILINMVEEMTTHPTIRLLKNIIRCFIHLTDNERVLSLLVLRFPRQFHDEAFAQCVKEDPVVQGWYNHLLQIMHVATQREVAAQRVRGRQLRLD